jgi:hypothetical protein
LNSDKDILDIPVKPIPIENMRIANLINFLMINFEILVKIMLKSKIIIDVTNIHRSGYIKEILTTKSMTFKRGYSITQYV